MSKYDYAEKESRHERESRRSSRRRSRTRSRSRSYSRRRHRDRSRSRSKSRRRSRRSRSRSYSPRRSHGGSRRDKGRSRSRSRERVSRKKPKSRSRSRSASPPKLERERSTSERAERAKQRELMELPRDHRTVFVKQHTQKVREKDLDRFFSKIGKVESVLLIRVKFRNRSKGFAYVELSNLEDVPKVLLLNGQVPDFQVFPIMIKASEADKSFAAKKTVMNASAANSGSLLTDASGGGLAGAIAGDSGMSSAALSAASRIYCGYFHTNITEDDLRIVFQSFGYFSIAQYEKEAGSCHAI